MAQLLIGQILNMVDFMGQSITALLTMFHSLIKSKDSRAGSSGFYSVMSFILCLFSLISLFLLIHPSSGSEGSSNKDTLSGSSLTLNQSKTPLSLNFSIMANTLSSSPLLNLNIITSDALSSSKDSPPPSKDSEDLGKSGTTTLERKKTKKHPDAHLRYCASLLKDASSTMSRGPETSTTTTTSSDFSFPSHHRYSPTWRSHRGHHEMSQKEETTSNASPTQPSQTTTFASATTNSHPILTESWLFPNLRLGAWMPESLPNNWQPSLSMASERKYIVLPITTVLNRVVDYPNLNYYV